uniref:RNA-dependent RNA polymerase n=1 Tax=Lentinula edodes partitivirus 2 TaxID=2491351 RepID=A0A7S6Z320_9VIRU|nr:RNA-dependent RNA polymerase [Lentinula edodes partitivirus 2]
MAFQQVRNYLQEFRNTVKLEWNIFNRYSLKDSDADYPVSDSDLRRLQTGFRSRYESELTDEYKHNYDQLYKSFELKDATSGFNFEFYEDYDLARTPDHRQPVPGIQQLPVKLHSEQIVTADATVPESGYALHPKIHRLVYRQYPQYITHVEKYCRPLGTTDATFSDFNKEQKEYPPVPTDMILQIVLIIQYLLNALPFRPMHYVDTFFAKMPLHTGTSYFYRHSYSMRTHAAYAHPAEYASKRTSKGYFLNSFTEWARTVVHRIKEFGYPFDPTSLSPTDIRNRLRNFFISHATMLFTRNHISDRDGFLKQRPVYAMDTLFLHLECMLTFPLHIMARSMKSSLMYSIETIRGGCHYMDRVAQDYRSYLCIDWSSFDQRMPWIIVDSFFTVFLPMLLIISHGYQPTHEYPTYPDLTPDMLFSRLFNILCFLRTWYFNCVFVTADGFAYIRLFAGIASGMLNTQYLDSYCNLFLIIHALFHFGCSRDEILSFCFFVMGDDNVVLSRWTISRLTAFLVFFEDHALTRFGMVLSKTKSIITTMRIRIEMLGYRCNGGHPDRPLAKLVAQLCYPEHGPIDKYMSSRAVGMAWASAGMDHIFYQFCRDMYFLFLDSAEHPDQHAIASISKHLPGIFKVLDDIEEFVSPDRFPDLNEIRDRFSHWQGELDPNKKWSPAHFTDPPFVDLPNRQTMMDYMLANNIQFPDVERLFA